MDYILHIAILFNIYIMLVLSTNVTIMSNLFTLCQAAFYGVGAYLGTFFLMNFNVPFVLIAIIVMLGAGLLSTIITFASVKLRGDYFILATLGFQMIVYTILYNWMSVTRGPYGIAGIPGIKLFGVIEIPGLWGYLVLSLMLAVVVIVTFAGLKKSPYGRVLRSIRCDELSLATLGRDVSFAKGTAFFISSAIAALAGVLYASYTSYIDPTSFSLPESLFIISALFIGGIGNVKGPVFGALFVVVFPELLRLIGLPEAIQANLRQVIYGLTLVVIMFVRPQGLLGQEKLK